MKLHPCDFIATVWTDLVITIVELVTTLSQWKTLVARTWNEGYLFYTTSLSWTQIGIVQLRELRSVVGWVLTGIQAGILLIKYCRHNVWKLILDNWLNLLGVVRHLLIWIVIWLRYLVLELRVHHFLVLHDERVDKTVLWRHWSLIIKEGLLLSVVHIYWYLYTLVRTTTTHHLWRIEIHNWTCKTIHWLKVLLIVLILLLLWLVWSSHLAIKKLILFHIWTHLLWVKSLSLCIRHILTHNKLV